MKFVGTDDSGFKIPMDASAIYGGKKEGVRPMELMLMSLGGCTGIELGHILNKMRVVYDRLDVEVNGNRVEEHPKVFSDIQCGISVKRGEQIRPIIFRILAMGRNNNSMCI